MAKEDLGKLSSEQLQKLANVIAEAKSLTTQEAEIIEKVLAGEKNIGELKISYLTQYFSKYYEELDKIASKHSELNKAFLILDTKLNNSYKAFAANNAKSGTNSSDPLKNTNDILDKKTNKLLKNNTDELRENTRALNVNNAELQQLSNAINSLSSSIKNSKWSKVNEASAGGAKANLIGKNTSQPDVSHSPAEEQLDLNGLIQSTVASSSTTFVPFEYTTTEPVAFNSSSDIVNAIREVTKIALYGNDSAATKESTTPSESGEYVESETRNQLKISATLDTIRKELVKTLDKELITVDAMNGSIDKSTVDRLSRIADNAMALQSILTNLAIAQDEANGRNQDNEYRLGVQTDAAKAELSAQNFINKLQASINYNTEAFAVHQDGKYNEASEIRANEVIATEKLKTLQALEDKHLKWKQQQELAAMRKNNGILSKEDEALIQKQSAEKLENDLKNLDKLTKRRIELEQKAKSKEATQAGNRAVYSAVSGELTKENNLLERLSQLTKLATDNGNNDVAKTIGASLVVATKAISDMAKNLENSVDKIALYQGNIDTRLQGSKNTTSDGSYWNQLTKDMMSVGAVTPFFKQEKFAENIKSLVDRGISFDLKQRAFLMTIQEKIATTFDVADSTLLRLIRLQQQDSTAGRLGMESALNAFLNEMYENTEYLQGVAANVRSSLAEMEALMSTTMATEVEYQVQKWMGSLYSVGMSQEAVQGIATALGQIAAGQVEGLMSGNGAGNLLVMAANDAGLSIADILTEGLDAEETNRLLQASVNYLADIAKASNNNVVQQQLAGVFGVKASDLRAAVNLASDNSTDNIFKSYMSYDNMLKQLNNMAGTMYKRTSIGEMMSNVWDNGMYTLASSMANNPVAYLTYKMASLLESTTGGIGIPWATVLGNGVSLETTVADLMRVAAIGTGVIGSIGPMIDGLSASFDGQLMLERMGINSGSGLKVNQRGDGDGISAQETSVNTGGGARTLSGSGLVGNSNSSDIKNATLLEADSTKNQLMIEAKEAEGTNSVDAINTTVVKIYELLEGVTRGSQTLRVRVDSYGLTDNSITGMSNEANLSAIGGGSTGIVIGSEGEGSSFGTSVINGDRSYGTIGLGGWTTL